MSDELHLTSPAPCTIPYPRNRLFVGRESVLAELERRLAAGETPALWGTGGMGKTQTAVELGYRLHAAGRYPGGVLWLNMADPGGIDIAIAGLAAPEVLDLPGWEPNGFARNQAVAWAALHLHIPRLLIFDNLEEPDLWLKWRPAHGGCQILITSRRQTWRADLGVQRVALPPLERPASLELLLTPRAGVREVPVATLATDPAADAICEAVGDLPLALALAAIHLEGVPALPLARYAAQLADQPAADPSLNAVLEVALPTGKAHGILATFDISYRQLQAGNPGDELARLLWHRAAQCAPAPIPWRLLVRLAAPDPDDELDEASESRANAAVNRLAGLGLVERLPDGTARLHRLLAAYARHRAPAAEADRLAVEVALILEAYAINRAGYPLAGTPYLDHLRHVVPATSLRADAQAAALLNNLAYLLAAQGDYTAARPLYARALAIDEEALGPMHPHTARSLNNLALLLKTQGDYAAARPLYERALTIDEEAYGKNHPEVAIDLNNLAALLYAQGDYAAARPLYERALAIREQAFGPMHPVTALSLNNLAELLRAQGDYAAARPLYERALAIREQALGPTHPDTAFSLNNLAGLLDIQGDYAAARPLYERALAICEQVLGSDHPTTRTVRANLADLLRDMDAEASGERE